MFETHFGVLANVVDAETTEKVVTVKTTVVASAPVSSTPAEVVIKTEEKKES
jgi:hypothetical protein